MSLSDSCTNFIILKQTLDSNIHFILGGYGGHMTYLDVAAFDPIFWFHRSNIDRIVALWQFSYDKYAIDKIPVEVNYIFCHFDSEKKFFATNYIMWRKTFISVL